MVETQLSKLLGTSDTLVGRAYSTVYLVLQYFEVFHVIKSFFL